MECGKKKHLSDAIVSVYRKWQSAYVVARHTLLSLSIMFCFLFAADRLYMAACVRACVLLPGGREPSAKIK